MSDELVERLCRAARTGGHDALVKEAEVVLAIKDAELAAEQNRYKDLLQSWAEVKKLRDEAKAELREVYETLNAIGNDFGVVAGERHTVGIRRVLTKLRAELAAERAQHEKTFGDMDAAFRALKSQREALEAELAAERERLDEFCKHKNWSLQYKCPVYGDDDDQEECWIVHAEHGGINDREWTVIGKGASVSEAINAALNGGGGD